MDAIRSSAMTRMFVAPLAMSYGNMASSKAANSMANVVEMAE
ncbi:hypothetical protein [Rhizobium leguminosarum]|nr:hypothetical protein [Rhizobium leguminosarum]